LALARRLRVLAFLFRHREEQARLFEPALQALEAGEPLPDFVLFLERRLRDFGLVPEVGFGGLFEKFVLACGQAGEVKDASRVCLRGLRGRSVVRVFHSASGLVSLHRPARSRPDDVIILAHAAR